MHRKRLTNEFSIIPIFQKPPTGSPRTPRQAQSICSQSRYWATIETDLFTHPGYL